MKKGSMLIGYAYGQAAGDPGCADGPEVFKKSTWFKSLVKQHPTLVWDDTFYAPSDLTNKFLQVQAICQRLALKTQALAAANQRFIVIGGDHSSAIGTWSGVYEALHTKGHIGLIWIDAHMDSHTPETSPSGNIHGMPLATLFGYGNSALTDLIRPTPKLLPQQVCLIGVRSFESGEAELLHNLGVRIFKMEEIKQRSLATVFQEALFIVQKNTVGFGLSIDLDGLDPQEVPAVGTPAADGLSTTELCQLLSTTSDNPNFMGAEIVEFNPHHDEEHKTEKVLYDLIQAMV